MSIPGTLIFFCGKMGAGKSTLARRIADQRNAVLISEDEWLAALFPDQIGSFADYKKRSDQLKPLLELHVPQILNTGTDVVMDFAANTKQRRKWLAGLAVAVEAEYELNYLKVSDEQCLQQIAQRRVEQPERAAFDTEEVFRLVTGYFEEPDEAEQLTVREIARSA